MGEVLLAGLTHYPPLSLPDDHMADILRMTCDDPGIPDTAKDPGNWPLEMQVEWGTDEGLASASRHREELVTGLRAVRQRLEEFDPDFLVVWGDDQHENFQEDLIPAFAVLAYDDVVVEPWARPAESAMTAGKLNVWNEPRSTTRTIKGHPEGARWLLEELIPAGFDTAYSYRYLHHPGYSHAFMNTVLYLDYDRQGFDWPIVAMPINCYGRKVLGAKGFMSRFDDHIPPDPPSPAPSRLIAFGAAVAEAALRSPWRVALMASSSWSHAFLCDHTWRIRPDISADRNLYQALESNNLDVWSSLTLEDLEHAGQQEMLSWCALVGAVKATQATLEWSMFVESYCFNSNKVFAVWNVVDGPSKAVA